MILDKFIEVTINPSNYRRLKELGYIFKNTGDKIVVDARHLSNGSNAKVNVKCSFCGEEKQIDYCNYMIQIKKGDNNYYCKNCKNEKSKYTNIKKYGVDNVSKSDIIKQKKINTTLKNYGVEHTFQCKLNKDPLVCLKNME